MQDSTLWSKTCFSGALLFPSPPLEYVVRENDRVVIQCGGKLSTRYTGSGGAKSGSSCVLPGVTWHKLPSDLQMSNTSAGLGGSQERPSCVARPAASSARPGLT